jgi:hypothetical protein
VGIGGLNGEFEPYFGYTHFLRYIPRFSSPSPKGPMTSTLLNADNS